MMNTLLDHNDGFRPKQKRPSLYKGLMAELESMEVLELDDVFKTADLQQQPALKMPPAAATFDNSNRTNNNNNNNGWMKSPQASYSPPRSPVNTNYSTPAVARPEQYNNQNHQNNIMPPYGAVSAQQQQRARHPISSSTPIESSATRNNNNDNTFRAPISPKPGPPSTPREAISPPTTGMIRARSSEASAELSRSLAEQYREMFTNAARQESERSGIASLSESQSQQASWNDMRPQLSKAVSRDNTTLSNGSMMDLEDMSQQQNMALPAAYNMGGNNNNHISNAQSPMANEYSIDTNTVVGDQPLRGVARASSSGTGRDREPEDHHQRGLHAASSFGVPRPGRNAKPPPATPPLIISTQTPRTTADSILANEYKRAFKENGVGSNDGAAQRPPMSNNNHHTPSEPRLYNSQVSQKPPLAMPTPRTTMGSPLVADYRALVKGNEEGKSSTKEIEVIPMDTSDRSHSNYGRTANGSRGRALPIGRQERNTNITSRDGVLATGRDDRAVSPHAARGRIQEIRNDYQRAASPHGTRGRVQTKRNDLNELRQQASVKNMRGEYERAASPHGARGRVQTKRNDLKELKQTSVKNLKNEYVRAASPHGTRGRVNDKRNELNELKQTSVKSLKQEYVRAASPHSQRGRVRDIQGELNDQRIGRSVSPGALSGMRRRGDRAVPNTGGAGMSNNIGLILGHEKPPTSPHSAMDKMGNEFNPKVKKEKAPKEKTPVGRTNSGGVLSKMKRRGKEKSKEQAVSPDKASAEMDNPEGSSKKLGMKKNTSWGTLSKLRKRDKKADPEGPENSMQNAEFDTPDQAPAEPEKTKKKGSSSKKTLIKKTFSGGALSKMRKKVKSKSTDSDSRATSNAEFEHPASRNPLPTGEGMLHDTGSKKNMTRPPGGLLDIPSNSINDRPSSRGRFRNGLNPQRNPGPLSSGSSGRTRPRVDGAPTNPRRNTSQNSTQSAPAQLRRKQSTQSQQSTVSAQTQYSTGRSAGPPHRPGPAPTSSGAPVGSQSSGYRPRPPPQLVYEDPGALTHKKFDGATMIEISPGVKLPLVDYDTTKRAVERNMIGPQNCMDCQRVVNCVDVADFVICPHCQVVSPTQSNGRRRLQLNGDGQKVALGFTGKLDL